MKGGTYEKKDGKLVLIHRTESIEDRKIREAQEAKAAQSKSKAGPKSSKKDD